MGMIWSGPPSGSIFSLFRARNLGWKTHGTTAANPTPSWVLTNVNVQFGVQNCHPARPLTSQLPVRDRVKRTTMRPMPAYTGISPQGESLCPIVVSKFRI